MGVAEGEPTQGRMTFGGEESGTKTGEQLQMDGMAASESAFDLQKVEVTADAGANALDSQE